MDAVVGWVLFRVLGHLTDDDLVSFFVRCAKALKAGGWIGVKENISKTELLIDEVDSSCTRTDVQLKVIFARAGLKVIKEETQRNFPTCLYPVKMYLLQP
jgi:protein N-terminal methyltransferase